MKKIYLLLFLVSFFLMSTVSASETNTISLSQGENSNRPVTNSNEQQEISVSGKVVGLDGEPIPGVNVIIQGTNSGTITDLNGKYTISASPDGTLEFSFIGYLKEVISIAGQTVIDVTLIPDIHSLEEIVVVGYGIQKKSDVTGAMVSVSSQEITSRPVNNVLEAMQGKAAGVDITSNERPGEIGKIYIRGQRSLNASNSPLYVVDGIPLSSGGIETINPRDIESIDILKDASATAIYGSRGANGVVIVTTKSGKAGSFKLNYSANLTIEEIEDKAPVMNASDYITWRRWAYYNLNPTRYERGDEPSEANDAIIFSNALDDTRTMDNVLSGWNDGEWDGFKVINTDWTDFVKQTGITQEHTLSASGGSDQMNTYASFGYLNNEGTQIGQDYNRYSTKVSLNISPKNWFKMGGTVNASWSKQNYGFSQFGQSSGSGPNSIYDAAKEILNIALPYNEDGEIIYYPGGNSGTYTIIDEWNKSTDQRQTLRALGSFYAGLNFGKILSALEGLNYRLNVGTDYRNYRRGVYIDKSSAVRLGGTSLATWGVDRRTSWTLDNIISYDKQIGQHKVGITLLQSASANNYEGGSMSEENVPKASYLWNNMGAVDITSADSKASMNTGFSESQLASYMGRVNYSLFDKYLITLSGRYDGSSVLADGHKWAFFPSAALGWRISQEEFMKNLTYIDQLKLRVGYGTTGNAAVSAYQTSGEIQAFYVPFGGEANVLAYGTNEPYYNGTQVSLANSLLGWESTTQYNIGLDFSFIKGRIGGTIDAYKSSTTDLLMNMVIPTLTGYPETLANVGATKNKGIDISLNFMPVQSNVFKWEFSINGAYQKDEIVELANGKQDMIDNNWFIGQSISVFYGLESNDLWQESESEEMAKFNANGHSFEAGKVKPVDQNGDYIIDADDRIILGNQLPAWILGLSNSFEYKNFDFSFMLYGRFGYMVSTGGEDQLGMYQQRQIDYWTPENTGAEWQKPVYSQAGGDPYSGLLGFKDASFLKIRNISLGYTLPSKSCKVIGIESIKVYAQAKNLGMIYSSIDWIDLDLGTSIFNRGIVFGLEVGF